jgi:DNA-binding transcriptional ArsR family regulator
VTVFEVIAEPHRRRILDLLQARERSVGELVQRTGLSQTGVSKHLRILRETGLVTARVQAQNRVYRVEAAALREIDRWLVPYRQMWMDALDDLAEHLEEM